MVVRFYEPLEGTEHEHRIAAGELFVPAGGGDGDSVSTFTTRAPRPRDYDIICSNGMTNHSYERHPGNIRLKQIIEGKARREQ